MRGLSGGRDRSRAPGADKRTERNARLQGLPENAGAGLAYDRAGRLGLDVTTLARIEALEQRSKAVRFTPARDETSGTTDGILEAIPDVGAGYVQADQQAVNAAVANNFAEMQAEIEQLRAALRAHGIVRD